MAKPHEHWTVFPHGPLEPITENLWRVQGITPKTPLKRVMSVVRRNDGRLVFHSVVALEENAMKRLEAWGEPSFMLVPNRFHRVDIKIYKQRYPSLRVITPSSCRPHIESIVPVDATYEQFPRDEAVRLETLEGLGGYEGVVHVRSDDGNTLIFNDALFNMPHQDGMGGILLKLLGSSGGPRITRVFRWMAMKDSKAFRAHLERLAATPKLRRIVVSHHEMITVSPAETLRAIAATLGQ